MEPEKRIFQSAEDAFDRHGFTATGMDRLAAAAELSSRTLYKHVGSKNALIATVLKARCTRFFTGFDVHSVDALFAALEEWTHTEGARGCLFLRAEGETGGELPEVSDAVTAYRRRLRELISRVVANDTGQGARDELVEQILVLFEGAISAASYRGTKAINAARTGAAVLVNQGQNDHSRFANEV